MNDYNHMDWILHRTKEHTPAGYLWCSPDESPLGLDIKWWVTDARHDADGTTQEIEANSILVKFAPLLREEVVRLREEVKRLRSIADDLYAYIVSDADISLDVIEEQMEWRDEE